MWVLVLFTCLLLNSQHLSWCQTQGRCSVNIYESKEKKKGRKREGEGRRGEGREGGKEGGNVRVNGKGRGKEEKPWEKVT